MLELGVKMFLISTILLGVLIPFRARLLSAAGDEAAPDAGPFTRHRVIGLLRPLAVFLDQLVAPTGPVPKTKARHIQLAVALVFTTPLAAFAVIPFGSRYAFGEGHVDLVIANVEWGIVWLLGVTMVSLYGALALIPTTAARVRHAILAVSFATGAGLALVALAMRFETLNLSAISVAQDQTFSLGAFFGPALPGLQSLSLPGWGIFYQPISFLIFIGAAVGLPHVALDQTASRMKARLGGAGTLLVLTSEHLASLVTASVVAALFLGGGAIPYVTGEEIIAAIATYYGKGLATLLCMAIHSGVFFAKVIALTVALEPLRKRVMALDFGRSMNLCWKAIVPLAMANLFVVAQMLGIGGPTQ
jgi:NADH-quinone oxidoreductase subunit H